MDEECSHCRAELARLTEENAALRRAAITFGTLAERLNASLQEARQARQRQSTSRDAGEAQNV
jgi:hypothetical protein